MAELNISGRLTVKTLKAQFAKSFGLELRIYKGNNFADPDATLASISSKKVDDFECSLNMLVGNFEIRFKEATGLKVQVATLPNARVEPNLLVNNKFTLGEARTKFSPLFMDESTNMQQNIDFIGLELKKKESILLSNSDVNQQNENIGDKKNHLDVKDASMKISFCKPDNILDSNKNLVPQNNEFEFDKNKFEQIYYVSNPRYFDLDSWEAKISEEISYSIDFEYEILPNLSFNVLKGLKFDCEFRVKTAKENIPKLKKDIKTNPLLQNFLNSYQYMATTNTRMFKLIEKQLKKR